MTSLWSLVHGCLGYWAGSTAADAWADHLVLRNGDMLTGKVTSNKMMKTVVVQVDSSLGSPGASGRIQEKCHIVFMCGFRI